MNDQRPPGRTMLQPQYSLGDRPFCLLFKSLSKHLYRYGLISRVDVDNKLVTYFM